MTPTEFEALRAEDKSVVSDIHFRPTPDYGDGSYEVDGIEVYCTVPNLCLNMTFGCDPRSFSCNFTVAGVGAIHRYDLNGSRHDPGDRHHQHEIRTIDCVRQQLPHVVRRDDLIGKTAREAWAIICEEFKIAHSGRFFEPEELC